jgi:hypothetical protein
MDRRAPLAPAVALVFALAAALLPGAALAGTPQTLTVTKVGTGHGSVVSDVQPGIDCGATCTYDFAPSTVVTLTATPNAASTFIEWRGDCTGTGTCQVTMDAPHDVRAVFDRSYRPDGWIKLCGQSTGCSIDPLPHPWRGNDVYNHTGRHQTVTEAMDNGEGVRFWILVQNDGVQADTITVQGCAGNRYFPVNRVLLGKQKRPNANATDVKRAFLNGTLSFDLGPTEKAIFTLNVVTSNDSVGRSYHCRMTLASSNDDTVSDTVVASMSSF